jgi:hypothetical protein
VFRFLLWAILAALKPKALLVAENLCLRQQLPVLQRRQPRPTSKPLTVLLGSCKPMARQLAQSSPRRKAQNSVEVASAWLAPLLVLAITDEAMDRPSSNSPTASGAHPTDGRGKQTLGPKANTG